MIYRSDRGDLRVGPCPFATKEPGSTETTPPKKEVVAAPMAPKATAKAPMAPKATAKVSAVPVVKVSAPLGPKATGSAMPAEKRVSTSGEPNRSRPGQVPARMAPKAAVHEVKVSATPMAPKATGSTTPASKPVPVHGEPRRPRPGQVPKTVPEPYPKGSRGETKFGPPRPNQQRQQPPTCWHFVRNHGWCPWRERCWFGHVKKSKAKKRLEARARQRARARNAASSSAPQATAPQTADPGRVSGNSRPTVQTNADGKGVSPARSLSKRPRPIP